MRYLCYSILLAVLSLWGCSNSDSTPMYTIETSINRQDTLPIHQTPTSLSNPLGDLKLDSIMQGVWFADTTENALFYINQDTLVYVEHLDQIYHVYFSNDTVTFLLDEGFKALKRVRIIDERTILMITLPEERDSLVLYRFNQ